MAIGNEDDYKSSLAKAEELSRDGLQKLNLDEELSESEKANLAEAATEFEALVSYKADQFAPHLALGMIYRGLGNKDAAEKNLRQCLENLPEEDSLPVRATKNEAHYQLSRVLVDKGDFQGALVEAAVAADADPQNPNYQVGKASALAQLDRKPEAIRALDHALKLDPNHKRARGLKKLLN
jgi:Flp pilus assembly protein TadD